MKRVVTNMDSLYAVDEAATQHRNKRVASPTAATREVIEIHGPDDGTRQAIVVKPGQLQRVDIVQGRISDIKLCGIT